MKMFVQFIFNFYFIFSLSSAFMVFDAISGFWIVIWLIYASDSNKSITSFVKDNLTEIPHTVELRISKQTTQYTFQKYYQNQANINWHEFFQINTQKGNSLHREKFKEISSTYFRVVLLERNVFQNHVE